MLPKLSWEYCSRWCLELHFVWNSSCCFNDMERTPWAIFSVIKVGMRAFQVALVVKNQPANAGDVRDTGSISVSGRSHGGGHGDSLQYSCLENHMDRGAWQAVAHRVSQSQTRLKQFSTHAYMHTGLEWGKGGPEEGEVWYLRTHYSGVRLPGIKSWLQHSLAVWPLTSFLTTLYCRDFICKMRDNST